MKTNTIILLALAALLTLAGCLKDPGPADGGGLRMQVEPSVAEATKGSLTTGTLQDFYLRVVSGDPAYSYFVHLSKDGSGAWVSPTQLLWKGADASVDYAAARFGAYAFKAADFASGVSVALTVPADQSTQERLDAADLLTVPTATKAYSATVAGALPVAFRHALAKVRFTLTLGPDFYDIGFSGGGNPVRDFTVKGVNGGFSFTPSTGAVSDGDTPVDIVPLAGTFTPGTSESKNATATYEAILVPQEYPAGALKVAFRVGDYEYEWTNAASLTLAAGKTYELPLSATTAPPPIINGYGFVDLGLPSGLKWAICNVGATNSEGYGDYFAWGETAPKADYSWSTLKYCTDINDKKFSRYVPSGKEEFWGGEPGSSPDNRTVLEANDDAATANWGAPWRTPTNAEWEELRDNCTSDWITQNGVKGYRITSKKNGASFFLPAAGYRLDTNLDNTPPACCYWSSSLVADRPHDAQGRHYTSDKLWWRPITRSSGLSVRPVTD